MDIRFANMAVPAGDEVNDDVRASIDEFRTQARLARTSPGRLLPVTGRVLVESICKAILGAPLNETRSGFLTVHELTRQVTESGAWSGTDRVNLDVGVLWSMGNHWVHHQPERSDLPPEYAAAISHAGEALISWYLERYGAEKVPARLDEVKGPWVTCFHADELLLCAASGTRLEVRPFGDRGRPRSVDVAEPISSLAIDQVPSRIWLLTEQEVSVVPLDGSDRTVLARPEGWVQLHAVHRTEHLTALLGQSTEGIVEATVGHGAREAHVRLVTTGGKAVAAAWIDDYHWLAVSSSGHLLRPPVAAKRLMEHPIQRLSSLDVVDRPPGPVFAAGAEVRGPAGTTAYELWVIQSGVDDREGLRRIVLPGAPVRVAIACGGPDSTVTVTVQVGEELLTFEVDAVCARG